MGMLFNTDATVEILKMTNVAFNRDGFKRIKKENSQGITNWHNILTNLSVANDLYSNVAKTLGIEFDVGSGGKSPRASRWRRYLKYLDKTPDSAAANPPQTLAQSIGLAIDDAINKDYAAVEFFAVPTSTATSSVTSTIFPLAGGGVHTTKIITISTLDADSAFAAANV